MVDDYHLEGGRVLVTGAGGFIGSHLVDHLVRRGLHVIAVDNFDPWYPESDKRRNLAAAVATGRVEVRRLDVATDSLDLVLDGVDVVFHLAGRAGVQDSWGPGFAVASQANVVATQRLCEAALVAGVRRLVLASSSSVYGTGSTAAPGSERASVSPISPYGASKAAAEMVASVYARQGLDLVVLRYFTVFGPRQRPDMAMRRLFAATVARGPAFHRRGTGEQRREFTYVDDVIAATEAAGAAPGAGGEVVDVGGGCTASLNEVIAAVETIAGARVRLVAEPAAPGDPDRTVADLTVARRVLNWAPTTSLSDGLREQWCWHRRVVEEGPSTAPPVVRRSA